MMERTHTHMYIYAICVTVATEHCNGRAIRMSVVIILAKIARFMTRSYVLHNLTLSSTLLQ